MIFDSLGYKHTNQEGKKKKQNRPSLVPIKGPGTHRFVQKVNYTSIYQPLMRNYPN